MLNFTHCVLELNAGTGTVTHDQNSFCDVLSGFALLRCSAPSSDGCTTYLHRYYTQHKPTVIAFRPMSAAP